jgi:hypothetical protein
MIEDDWERSYTALNRIRAFGALLGEHALVVFMRAPSLADLILRANPSTNAGSDSDSSFRHAKI